MFEGPCVRDACQHFIEYWNFASFQLNSVKRSVLVVDSSKTLPVPQNTNTFAKQFLTDKWKKINNIIFRKDSRNISENSEKYKTDPIFSERTSSDQAIAPIPAKKKDEKLHKAEKDAV